MPFIAYCEWVDAPQICNLEVGKLDLNLAFATFRHLNSGKSLILLHM